MALLVGGQRWPLSGHNFLGKLHPFLGPQLPLTLWLGAFPPIPASFDSFFWMYLGYFQLSTPKAYLIISLFPPHTLLFLSLRSYIIALPAQVTSFGIISTSSTILPSFSQTRHEALLRLPAVFWIALPSLLPNKSSFLSLELCTGLWTDLPVSNFSQSSLASSLPGLNLPPWWLTGTTWLQSSSVDSSTHRPSFLPPLPCVQTSPVNLLQSC